MPDRSDRPASGSDDRRPPGTGFRHTGETERLQSHVFSVVEAAFVDPAGRRFTRHVLRHPGAVAVVPVTADGEVVLVRQYRGAMDREMLEIPAGTRDVADEPPETTARRELAEEAGLTATHVELLGTMANSPGVSDQVTLLYLATGLEPCPTDRVGVEEAYMDVVRLPLDAACGLASSGDVVDAQTLLGVQLARTALELRR